MTPRAVLFDCDGVLVDSERMEATTLAIALTWVGADLDAQALHSRHRGGTLTQIFDEVAVTLGRPMPDGFEERYRDLQLSRLTRVTAVPGAGDLVAAVATSDLPTAVVSGGPMEKMNVSLRATGLWDTFAPNIFSCYDIGDHKPSPGIYLHALARLGITADGCVAIEDSVNGVRAAATAGVEVIGLARDTDPSALAAAGASHVVGSLGEAGVLLGNGLRPR